MKHFITKYMLFALMSVSLFFLPQHLNAYSSSKIKPNFIKVNGQKYQRANAESAQLCAIGSKRVQVGKIPKFERKELWQFGKVQVTKDTIVTLTTSQTNTLSAQGHAPTQAGIVGARVSTSSSLNGNLVLVKFKANDLDIIKRINALSKNTRKRIKKYKHGRIITAIWVLVSGQEIQSGSYNGVLTLTNQDVSGDVRMSNRSGTAIRFSPNTIIAYEYKKFKWKKGKKVKELKTDYSWR